MPSVFRMQAEIKGLEPLIRSMAGLKKGLRNKTLRSAMRKSASIVNKAAKANLKAGKIGSTGELKRSLGVKVKVYPSGVVIGVVEPRAGFGGAPAGYKSLGGGAIVRQHRVATPGTHNPRKIAHLVEFGTKLRMNKRGANRGVMPATPFLGPAFSANEGAIVEIFAAEVGKALDEL